MSLAFPISSPLPHRVMCVCVNFLEIFIYRYHFLLSTFLENETVLLKRKSPSSFFCAISSIHTRLPRTFAHSGGGHGGRGVVPLFLFKGHSVQTSGFSLVCSVSGYSLLSRLLILSSVSIFLLPCQIHCALAHGTHPSLSLLNPHLNSAFF